VRGGPWERVFLVLALAAAVYVMCGCSETRAERKAQTDKTDVIRVRGIAHVPGVGSVPVELDIDRTGSESFQERSESHTKIDSAAIAQQLGAVIGKTMDAAITKMTGIQPQGGGLFGGNSDLMAVLGGTGGIGGMAYAVAQMFARRNERKEHEEVKADRDKAWDELVATAKKLPPENT
jgi:hypothetical protein